MRFYLLLLFAATIVFAPTRAAVGQEVGQCEPAVAEAFLDVNNVRAKILNNGGLFWDGNQWSYEVPKGSGNSVIFSSSMWLGGLVEGRLKTAGSVYGPYEFWPGPLDEKGQAPADCEPYDRVWSITRREITEYLRTGEVSSSLRDWPTGLGAPTLDRNGARVDVSGLASTDRLLRRIDLERGELPEISGDQMLWWIMNDMGGPHERFYTSYDRSATPPIVPGAPIGVEIQGTAIAINHKGVLDNTTFYRLRIVKPFGPPLESAYFGVQQDADLGDFADDFVGSDSLLGLAFTYNADNDDFGHYGNSPPAVGLDFVRGALVDQDGLDNDDDGDVDEIGERTHMTSFMFYHGGGGIHGDPSSASDMYNYLRGLWKDGKPQTWGGNGVDYSNIPAPMAYTGEPPAAWSEFNLGDGRSNHPADRRWVASTGPFRVAPEEPQELVFAVITSFGKDNLDSVRELKKDDAIVQNLVDLGLIVDPTFFRARTPPSFPVPETFDFGAWVYPVPAAESATLVYTLPIRMAVRVRILDTLGRVVETWVEGSSEPGRRTNQFDVSSWAPGMYVVHLQLDSHSFSRRMVVAR